ncbi:TPA: hypothetical protein ACHKTX_005425, partial [Escherichia coli]
LVFIFHCVTNNNSVKNSEINYTINYTVSRTISNNHEQRSTRFSRYHFPAIRYEAGGCSPIWGSPPTGIFARLNVNRCPVNIFTKKVVNIFCSQPDES